MAEVINSTAEMSLIIPEVWSQKYYDVLLAELPFNSLVTRDYEGEISALGDTVHISTIGEFSEGDEFPEVDAVEADPINLSQQDLVINKRVAKDFIVTNQAKLQSLPFVEKLKQLAIYSIQKKIQAIIIAATIPSAAPDHSINAATPGTFDLVDILTAKELLDNQNVPMSDRHMVLGAGPLNDLFRITGFTSSDFVASGSPLQSGQLPAQLAGFMPHFTTVVANTVYAFHTSYFTMASQQGMQVKEYDLGHTGKRQSRVNCDTLFGVKQLDGKRVVTVTV